MDPLCTLPATRLAEMVRAREVSARALVEAHAAQIAKANPSINALVALRLDRARAEADAADARLARGDDDLPPFFGVPCTIKEAFALEGMPWTSGFVARKDVRALGDATAVARLRAAGAIPLGVTNTSELCMWFESFNRVYGRTTSAYDPARIAGGSSGGEGAAVGSGMSPFGLGSDVGGSIRLPAFFNGVFGHKPSGGLVPNTGQYPSPTGTAGRMLSTGPLCRSARDLYPLLRVLAGPDGEDAWAQPIALHDPAEVALRGLTVWDVRPSESFGLRFDDDLVALQDRAVRALAARGCRVVSTTLPALRDAFEVWSAAMYDGNAVSFAQLLGGARPMTPPRALAEIPRVLGGHSPHTLAAVGLALFEDLPRLMPKRLAQMRDRRARLQGTLTDLLGRDGVMIVPTYPRVSPRHHEPLAQFPGAGVSGIVNALALPSTAVPGGLDAQGRPLGLQVVGPHGGDALCLAAALALEDALGGWVPPPRWS